MPELGISEVTLAATINRITSAARGRPHRMADLWGPVHEILPFSAAWLGILDGDGRSFSTATDVGDDLRAREYVESTAYLTEVNASGIFRGGRSMCLRDGGRPAALPFHDRLWWQAGQHDGLAMPLSTVDGRAVGLLVLVTDGMTNPGETGCRVMGEVGPIIAAGIDPMTSIIGLTGLVEDVRAAAVIDSSGAVELLPGSPGHPLLVADSALVATASERLRDHRSPTTFLFPYPRNDVDDYLRVTVIACPPVLSSPFATLLILSPPGDVHRLTRRELEVMGLVIDGSTNRQIASTLFVTQRTVAAHLEHIRSKLDVPTRTAAAVRSLENTLYLPPQLAGTNPRRSSHRPA